MRIRSLSTRLLGSATLLMLVFFGVTVFALDRLYRDYSDNANRTRLDLQVANLISASDEQAGGKLIPGETMREVRFGNLGSGLYGLIERDDGTIMWQSASLTGTGLNLHATLEPGQHLARDLQTQTGAKAMALSVGLEWEFSRRVKHRFVYTVAEDQTPYRAELRKFRTNLIAWFSVLTVLLLMAFAGMFRWVLKPLRQIEREIEAIEAGERHELSGKYPRELAGVTENLNALLRSDRERLARYRNTLGNLAHSLKTPLAVVRSLARDPQLQEQVTRMDEIVSYQLKRAAVAGGSGLGHAPIAVREVVEPLKATLDKVYADKRLQIELAIDGRARFVGDRGDLMEIAGNLLDNACKWCRKRVRFTASPLTVPQSRREGLLIVVEDDGPGIAAEQRELVLKRGARLDERVSGQGIGLSVVLEIAQLSGGGVDIDTSPLGGSKITVRLAAQ